MGLTRLKAQQISNIDYKQAVRVITTANVTLSGGAPNTVDSVNLAQNDRVLVKGQDTASENGLYYVAALGTGSNGTWLRTSDANQNGEIQAGMIVMVTEGNSFKDTQWKLTTNDPIIIGTTPLTFELNTSTNTISNGNSSVSIGTLGGNANVSINGVANVAVFTTTGLTANNIATDGNLLVGNNLVVNGNLTYVNVTDLNIEDPIIGLGRGPNNAPLTSNDGKDRGEQLWYYTTSEQSAFIGYDNSAGKLIAASNVSISNEIVTVNSYGTLVVGTLEGTTVSATANIVGGNIQTVGSITATGNIQAGNLLTAGLISATGTATVGNVVTGGTVSASGNIDGGNIRTAGLISATGSVTATSFVGNVSATTVSVAGNITGGNLLFGSGIVSGTGNIYANKIFANITGNIDAAGSNTQVQFADTGDLLGASANFTFDKSINLLTVSNGNILGGNLLTGGVVSAAGNITSANLLTGGLISATGDLTAGNLLTDGSISAAGNVRGTNVIATNLTGTLTTGAQTNISLVGTLTSLSVSGNIQSGTNIGAIGSVSGAGNVIGGNITTAGLITATGNVTGGNILTVGLISATGAVTAANITGSNLLTAGLISATGNITANFYSGNGRQLTGQGMSFRVTAANNLSYFINGSYANATITLTRGQTYFFENSASNHPLWIKTDPVIGTGNAYSSGVTNNGAGVGTVGFQVPFNAPGMLYYQCQFHTGMGGVLNIVDGSTIQSGNSNVQVANNGNISMSVAGSSNVMVVSTDGISVTGNITGNYIIGNGSQLTGLPPTYTDANVTTLLANLGANTISSTGNITSGNLFTSGDVSATGNITGNYILGNGSQLTGMVTSSISNGTSNVVIPTVNGNTSIYTAGQETVEVSPGELTVYGVFSNPKNITSNVVIGPNINSMLIGPINVDPNNNIFVPTGSTLNII
jgi:filamentous hemagglutinin